MFCFVLSAFLFTSNSFPHWAAHLLRTKCNFRWQNEYEKNKIYNTKYLLFDNIRDKRAGCTYILLNGLKTKHITKCSFQIYVCVCGVCASIFCYYLLVLCIYLLFNLLIFIWSKMSQHNSNAYFSTSLNLHQRFRHPLFLVPLRLLLICLRACFNEQEKLD